MKTNNAFLWGFGITSLLVLIVNLVIFLDSKCHWSSHPLSRKEYEHMIVEKHDVDALENLRIFYPGEHCVPYAIYLANFCDDATACKLVNEILKQIMYEDRRYHINYKDNKHALVYKSLARYYLEKGGALGNPECYRELSYMYDIALDVPRDTVKANYYKTLEKQTIQEMRNRFGEMNSSE